MYSSSFTTCINSNVLCFADCAICLYRIYSDIWDISLFLIILILKKVFMDRYTSWNCSVDWQALSTKASYWAVPRECFLVLRARGKIQLAEPFVMMTLFMMSSFQCMLAGTFIVAFTASLPTTMKEMFSVLGGGSFEVRASL